MSRVGVASDDIEVRNPKLLGVTKLSAYRIPIGIVGDYKPCMVKMANGHLLLTGFSIRNGVSEEYVFFYRSTDGGKTWSTREYRDLLGREPYLSIISDGTIFISTHVLTMARGNTEGFVYSYLYRSTDNGQTWQWIKLEFNEVLRASRQDGARPDTAPVVSSRNVLELHDGTLVFAVGSQHGSEFLWRSTDKGVTWDRTLESYFDTVDIAKYPYSIREEAFLSQAPSGELLSICRVSPKFFPVIIGTDMPRSEVDYFERMVLFRSKDGGRNWSYEEMGSYYGEMYPHILRLQDGRLLCTFTMRAAVKPQQPPLGLRAVLGKEMRTGVVFDFKHDRIVLDAKTPIGQPSGGGFGNTVQLDDGTLVTCYSYRQADGKIQCEVVRWGLPS